MGYQAVLQKSIHIKSTVSLTFLRTANGDFTILYTMIAIEKGSPLQQKTAEEQD
jgi:hypothetical protein